MRIRKSAASADNKIEMNMTSMIDVVFQLLAFFVMTFKIATQEGDFNIKMPLAATQSQNETPPLPPIKVRLTADADGTLGGIYMGEQPMTTFKQLNEAIMGIVGTAAGPSEEESPYEVELDADYNLRYENVVAAITAVSGHVDKSGHIVKLIEKLKFAPPKPPQ